MAFIIEPVVSNRALQLGKEEYIRPFPWGSNWSRIMITVWWYIPYASNFSGNFTLGVCRGQTGGYQSPTADAVISAPGNAHGNKTYTYTASPACFYAGSGGGTSLLSFNYNGSFTELTNTGSSNGYVSADLNNPSCCYILIYRGSTSSGYLTITTGMPASAAATTPYPARFNRLRAAELERTLDAGANQEHPYSTALRSYADLTCASGPFAWDSVCMSWSDDAIPAVITDLYAVRFAV